MWPYRWMIVNTPRAYGGSEPVIVDPAPRQWLLALQRRCPCRACGNTPTPWAYPLWSCSCSGDVIPSHLFGLVGCAQPPTLPRRGAAITGFASLLLRWRAATAEFVTRMWCTASLPSASDTCNAGQLAFRGQLGKIIYLVPPALHPLLIPRWRVALYNK